VGKANKELKQYQYWAGPYRQELEVSSAPSLVSLSVELDDTWSSVLAIGSRNVTC